MARPASDNTAAVWKFLRGKGFTPVQAAGIVGGLKGESGPHLDPSARNPTSGAIGIGQWLGRRARGVRPGDLQGQLRHLWSELQGPERAAFQRVKSAHTIEDAVSAWVRGFERPSAGEIASSIGGRNQMARDVFKRLGGVGGDPNAAAGGQTRDRPGAGGSTRTTTTVTPGVDNSQARAALVQQFLGNKNADVLDFAVQARGLRDIPEQRSTTTQRIPGSSGPRTTSALGGGRAGVSGARGVARITGPNPDRIIPAVKDFMRQISAVRGGKPVVGSDGTGHSYLTVNGNVSEHSTGHASDIPARGRELINLGQAALIAAGMPRAQARQAQGGLYNVVKHGRRYQIIFNTHEGGDHTDHLHVGIKGGRR